MNYKINYQQMWDVLNPSSFKSKDDVSFKQMKDYIDLAFQDVKHGYQFA